MQLWSPLTATDEGDLLCTTFDLGCLSVSLRSPKRSLLTVYWGLIP